MKFKFVVVLFLILIILFGFVGSSFGVSYFWQGTDNIFVTLPDWVNNYYYFISLFSEGAYTYFKAVISTNPFTVYYVESIDSYRFTFTNGRSYSTNANWVPTNLEDAQDRFDSWFTEPSESGLSDGRTSPLASQLALDGYITNFDITDTNDGTVIFEENEDAYEEDVAGAYDDYVDSLLNGGSSVSDVASSVGSSDWSNAIENEDSSSVTSTPSSIGSFFSNFFSLFTFVDNVKSAVSSIYSLITYASGNTTNQGGVYHYYGTLPEDTKMIWVGSTMLDFSWYDSYKGYADIIIVAFCYLTFIWNTFRKLPSIISGVDGGVTEIAKVSHTSGKGGSV